MLLLLGRTQWNLTSKLGTSMVPRLCVKKLKDDHLLLSVPCCRAVTSAYQDRSGPQTRRKPGHNDPVGPKPRQNRRRKVKKRNVLFCPQWENSRTSAPSSVYRLRHFTENHPVVSQCLKFCFETEIFIFLILGFFSWWTFLKMAAMVVLENIR